MKHIKTVFILTGIIIISLLFTIVSINEHNDLLSRHIPLSSHTPDTAAILNSTKSDAFPITQAIDPIIIIDSDPIPIKGVKTDIAAFIGETEKGPSDPRLITSFSEYKSLYGGFISTSYMPYAVKGFFDNGGQKLYISRINVAKTPILKGKFIRQPSPATVNGTPSLDAYLPALETLSRIDEISIIYAPNSDSISGLNQALIDQCELLKDRIVIFDPPKGNCDPDPISSTSSTFAAYYSPWVKIKDPLTNTERIVPPGGLIAGTYARNDLTRGVYEAPANIELLGAIGVEFDYDGTAQGRLNDKCVIPIVNKNGRGVIANAGRTLSRSTEYKYINMRRYENYLEESLSEGLAWVEGQSWSAGLESSIKACVQEFLMGEWQAGGLCGNTPQQAYSVTISCEDIDATQTDSDILIEVKVYMITPAQFTVFQIRK